MKIGIIDSGLPVTNLNVKRAVKIEVIQGKIEVVDHDVYDCHGHSHVIFSVLESYLKKEQIFSFKILNENLKASGGTLVEALKACAAYNVDIISVSISMNRFSKYMKDLSLISELCSQKGIKIVASGNNHDNEGIDAYPAYYNHTIGIDYKSENLHNSEWEFNYEKKLIKIGYKQELKWPDGKIHDMWATSYIVPHIVGILCQLYANKNIRQESIDTIMYELEKNYKMLLRRIV